MLTETVYAAVYGSHKLTPSNIYVTPLYHGLRSLRNKIYSRLISIIKKSTAAVTDSKIALASDSSRTRSSLP